jgi:hypothetical protein
MVLKDAKKDRSSSLSLTQALIRQSRTMQYPELPTHIPGVAVRLEDDKVPDDEDVVRYLGKSAIRSLFNTGRTVFRASRRITKLTSEQSQRTNKFKGQAISSGFRGLLSRTGGFSVSVFPSYEFKDWDKDALREALGPAYDQVVTERLEMSVTLPKGQESDTALTAESLKGQLLGYIAGKLSCNTMEAESLVAFKEVLEVNTKELGGLISACQVTLPENAGTVNETWSVTPRQI